MSGLSPDVLEHALAFKEAKIESRVHGARLAQRLYMEVLGLASAAITGTAVLKLNESL